MNDLPLQVRDVHYVEIDEAQGPHARRSEIQRSRGAEPACTDEEHSRVLQTPLAFSAYLRKNEMTPIPSQLVAGQLRKSIHRFHFALPHHFKVIAVSALRAFRRRRRV